jgi:hypothetical protein
MTVSELIAKLKDCAPGAEVTFICSDGTYDIRELLSDGEEVGLLS